MNRLYARVCRQRQMLNVFIDKHIAAVATLGKTILPSNQTRECVI